METRSESGYSRQNQYDAPSDAVILFNGTTASGWQHANGDEAKWTVADNALTVKPAQAAYRQNKNLADCQLHIEWRIDKNVKAMDRTVATAASS
jgi:hypothetical protein